MGARRRSRTQSERAGSGFNGHIDGQSNGQIDDSAAQLPTSGARPLAPSIRSAVDHFSKEEEPVANRIRPGSMEKENEPRTSDTTVNT